MRRRSGAGPANEGGTPALMFPHNKERKQSTSIVISDKGERPLSSS